MRNVLFILMVLCAVGNVYALPGPVGHWPLDEDSGTTAVDISGNGYDATVFADADLSIDGVYDGGVHFTGVSTSRLVLPNEVWNNHIQNTGAYTFCFWQKQDNPAQRHCAFGSNPNRHFQSHMPWDGGNIYFDTEGSRSQTAWQAAWTGQWVFWTFQQEPSNGGYKKLYANGVEVASWTATTALQARTEIVVGAKQDGLDPTIADFDDIRFYDVILTLDEIQEVMAGSVPGNYSPRITVSSNQLLYWPDTDSIIMNPTITDDDPNDLGEIGIDYGSILWSCSDSNVSFVDDSVANAVVNFSAPGTYQLLIEVTDEVPNTASATVTIELIEPVNSPPEIAVTSNRRVYWPDTDSIVMNPTITDDDPHDLGEIGIDYGSILWSCSDPNVSFDDDSIASAEVNFAAPGTYQLLIEVTDDEQNTTSAIATIDVIELALPDQTSKDIPGDLNRSFSVNLEDLVLFCEQWMKFGCEGYEDTCANIYDGEEDYRVNARDFAILSQYWQHSEIPLFINEVLASNFQTEPSNEGAYDDWIEIYNAGPVDIDMAGMYLTDNDEIPEKWQFPTDRPAETTIKSGRYLLIWADNPTVQPPSGLHAAFSIDADGDDLWLFDTDGQTVIDSVEFGDQTTDVSFGPDPDAGANWVTLSPTPGAPNNGAYLGLVADTKFSHNRGFYSSPFEVAITCKTADTTIYYTLDGSLPVDTTGTPTATAQKYDPNTPVITTTTCLRAVAVKPAWKSSNVDTQTYIFLDDVITSDVMNQNSPYLPSIMHQALTDLPTISIVEPGYHLRQDIRSQPRPEWTYDEFPISFEYLTPDGSVMLQEDAGAGRFGGHFYENRTYPWEKWSYRIAFRKEYGVSKLKAPLFEGFDNGIPAAETFDQLEIHSGSHDMNQRGFYMSALLTADTMLGMGNVNPHSRFVHVYFNGTYRGLYNLRERWNAAMVAEYEGGEKEDYEAVKANNAGGNFGTVEPYDGDGTVWTNAMTLKNSYEDLRTWVDMQSYVDFMLMFLFGNSESEFRAVGANTADGVGFLFWLRDPDGFTRDSSRTTNPGPGNIFSSLLSEAHPDFKMFLADRIHEHLFNGGGLTTTAMTEKLLRRCEEVEIAFYAEAARWGYMTPQQWASTGNPSRDEYIDILSSRPHTLLNGLKGNGYYPNVDAPVFEINDAYQHGGTVNTGDELSMSAPDGTIYYTLDGSDPRLPGGAINPSALIYSSTPVPLSKSAHVKSRALDNSEWSALNQATYAVGDLVGSLRINEIMYHPAATDPNSEFIELKNIGTETINLNLVEFANGIDFVFPDIELAPGELVVVDQNDVGFNTAYPGFSGVIAGQYAGRLDNDGDRLLLQDAIGNVIHDFKFKDGWYDITDGDGFSLTIRDASSSDPNNWGIKEGWRPSAVVGGSPGSDDAGLLPDPGSVVINEVLAHSHDTAPDWIELHNMTGLPINIGGWFLSDNNDDDPNIMKYEIEPGTSIPANGYIVFSEDLHFGTLSPISGTVNTPFGLSEGGDEVHLRSGSGGVIGGYEESEDFGASASNVAFGRHVKSVLDGGVNFVPMSVNTPGPSFEGAANAYPMVGPVVISEIMYNPATGNTGGEYLELHNITGSPVTLQDTASTETSPGIFTEEVVTWKFSDGIDFVFTAGTTIPANGYLIIAGDPTAFTNYYGSMPSGVSVIGPFQNGTAISNGGERLQIVRPGDQEYGKDRFWIRTERVTYDDETPWPVDADGNNGDGDSLQQKTPDVAGANYGNDVINWQAAVPDPGQ